MFRASAGPAPAIATVAASTSDGGDGRQQAGAGDRVSGRGHRRNGATDSTPAALGGCGALPGRLEPVNRALERDDVDPSARVLAERAQLRHLDPERAVVARLPPRARRGSCAAPRGRSRRRGSGRRASAGPGLARRSRRLPRRRRPRAGTRAPGDAPGACWSGSYEASVPSNADQPKLAPSPSPRATRSTSSSESLADVSDRQRARLGGRTRSATGCAARRRRSRASHPGRRRTGLSAGRVGLDLRGPRVDAKDLAEQGVEALPVSHRVAAASRRPRARRRAGRRARTGSRPPLWFANGWSTKRSSRASRDRRRRGRLASGWNSDDAGVAARRRCSRRRSGPSARSRARRRSTAVPARSAC